NLTVESNAHITSILDTLIASRSDLRPTVIASSAQGGLGAGAISSESAKADYTTTTTINGTLDAGATLSVEARSYVDGYGRVTADVGGLGADGETDAKVYVGYGSNISAAAAFTHVDIASGSALTGRNVFLNAIVEQMKVVVSTRTRATALGANSEATGRARVQGWNEVTLQRNSTIIGNVSTSITSEYQHVTVTADASAATDARVVAYGPNSPAALIKTSDLTVTTNQLIDDYHRNANRSGGFLDFGGSSEQGSPNFRRRIFWEALVVMLGEPNPWLEVDSTGKIVKLINITVHDDDGHTYVDDPFNNIHTVGTLSGTTITVDDIIYDHGANARFLANDPNVLGTIHSGSAPVGEIWGELGVFEFQQTWDYVKLLNSSNLNLVVNTIDVVNTLNTPVIEIRVDKIWDDVGS
ncbi:MAG: hypothetical protein GTO41_09225, partial [Burkholderiales bacterium]|nr:hypothetical protein [Burkholderiales bacterium]